jgi:hypothetical protein
MRLRSTRHLFFSRLRLFSPTPVPAPQRIWSFFFSDFYYYRIQMPAIQVPSRRFPWPFFPRSLYHDGDARERKEKKIGGADRPTGPRCDDPAPSRTGGSLSSKCSLWSTAYAPGALHVHGLYGKTFRAEPGGIIFCIRTSLISPCI